MTKTHHDPQTLAFYDREAEAYAARSRGAGEALAAFLARVPAGGHVLELGCGGGHDAEAMSAAGFEVTATDGSAGLAQVAERRLGRPVRVMLFEELDEDRAYDAVWANACLLHVPSAGLAEILRGIWRALKPGGVFHAGFKAGDGDGRDDLGRFYNFPDEAGLRAAYAASGPWTELEFRTGEGGGYDKVARTWMLVTVARA